MDEKKVFIGDITKVITLEEVECKLLSIPFLAVEFQEGEKIAYAFQFFFAVCYFSARVVSEGDTRLPDILRARPPFGIIKLLYNFTS